MKLKKSFFFIFIISGVIISFATCVNTGIRSNDPRGRVYAGSASCRQCHRSIYDSYMATTHFQTTRPASLKNIFGSFAGGHNSFQYNPAEKVVMERRDSGLYQVLYVDGKEHAAHRFDITFGLKHAQTFLYWEDNKTYELPLSYYISANTWAASPGYSSTEVNFRRFIGTNCFQCHSSFINHQMKMGPKGIEEVLDKSTLVMGIDCERCHGPAINHVNYHLAYPEVTEAKYIVSSQSLSRQQKLDACAVCHSGNDQLEQTSTFRFKMGDTLENFYSPFGLRANQKANLDVHGNQYGLLSQSKCFLKSSTLECSSCHDSHSNASTNLKVYSQKCIDCHHNPNHSTLHLDANMASAIKNNCIDCHMPQQPSRAISFQLAGSNTKTAYMLRTHRIAIYANIPIDKTLESIKNSQQENNRK